MSVFMKYIAEKRNCTIEKLPPFLGHCNVGRSAGFSRLGLWSRHGHRSLSSQQKSDTTHSALFPNPKHACEPYALRRGPCLPSDE